MNMARAELLGWGAQVAYHDLNEALLSEALEKVLTDPMYKKKVEKVANRLRDQPQTPMEKAIFWIEYVLRHDGAHHMQSSAQYLNYIENNNLDVYATFALAALLTIFIPLYVLRKIFRFLSSCKSSASQKSKKKFN